MSTFVTVDDQLLSQRIAAARSRVVLVAPAVSKVVVAALEEYFRKAANVPVTVVLDPDEDAYRIGYGDREGLEQLHKFAQDKLMALRSQTGLRIGLLLVDDDVLVWSPTPRSVENQRSANEPNGIDLGWGCKAASGPQFVDKDASDLIENKESQSPASFLADNINNAVGADDTAVLLSQAEIGLTSLTTEQVTKAVKTLKENPPAPFNLALKTRVFSTKFQFVEFELQGAEWTKREIKLSNLLLNPDVPDTLKDLFETRVKPFSHRGDVAIKVPALVQGQVAYNREGNEISIPMTQADIEKSWKELRERYLRRLPGFGWLIQKAKKSQFEADVKAFETVLKKWVDGFREDAENQEEDLVKRIVDLIKHRAERSQSKDKLKDDEIKAIVLAGIQKLRIIEPRVKIVFKEISWESTRDDEFTEALRKSLPAAELEGWFEVFTAAKERARRRNG